MDKAAESGRAGSYPLTYTVMDVAGNVGEKKITVKLTVGGGAQGGGQTASNPNTGGNTQQNSAQFMADMAKAAIACWYENGTYYWVNLFTG